jgi:hypothetical protein
MDALARNERIDQVGAAFVSEWFVAALEPAIAVCCARLLEACPL